MNELDLEKRKPLFQEYVNAMSTNNIKRARFLNGELYEDTLLIYETLQSWKEHRTELELDDEILKEMDEKLTTGLKLLNMLLDHSMMLAYQTPEDKTDGEENK